MGILNPEALTKKKTTSAGSSSSTTKTSPTPAPTSTASKSTSSSILDRAASGEFSNINADAVKTNIAKRTAGATTTTTTTPDSTYYPRYTQNEQAASDYLDTFQAPKSADQIQGEMLKSAQGEVNSLNDYYSQLLKEQQTVNQGNEQATASVNTLTGLAGSTEANVTAGKAAATSQQANDKILAQKQLELNTLLTNIRTSAQTEATTQQTNARLSAQDIMTNRATKMAEATTNVTQLAKSGVTVEGLKTSDPTSYAHLAQQVGGEAQLKAMFTLNRPQETILDKQVKDGSYVIAYQNPLTGAVRIETVDLGLPTGTVQVADAGGYILFGQAGPDGKWDGDMATTSRVDKSLSPDQKASNELGWYNATKKDEDGMTAGQVSAFNGIVNKYNASPLIAASDRTVVLKNTIDQINKDPGNGALQLNLVYSYIQALDTYQSAVREGELGLVNSIDSKVGQVQNYVQQIQNGQVVRPEVAKQIATAAQTLVDTIDSGAQRKAKSFESQAKTVGLGDQWGKYIGGFEQGYSNTQNQPQATTKSGVPFDVESAKASGYSDQEIQDYINNN